MNTFCNYVYTIAALPSQVSHFWSAPTTKLVNHWLVRCPFLAPFEILVITPKVIVTAEIVWWLLSQKFYKGKNLMKSSGLESLSLFSLSLMHGWPKDWNQNIKMAAHVFYKKVKVITKTIIFFWLFGIQAFFYFISLSIYIFMQIIRQI